MSAVLDEEALTEDEPTEADLAAESEDVAASPGGKPCECRCGRPARPGSRFIKGHHLRRKTLGAMSDRQAEAHERALGEPAVAGCERCGWRSEPMPARNCAVAFRRHPCRRPDTADTP